jgi:hypothetical protein
LSAIKLIAAMAALVAVAVLIRLWGLGVPMMLGLPAVLLGSLIALSLGVHVAGYVAMIAFVLIVLMAFPWWPGAG